MDYSLLWNPEIYIYFQDTKEKEMTLHDCYYS